MNRKQRRDAKRQARKSGNKELDEKLSLVSSLDDKCRACHKSFNRNDAKMLSEWMIVVREDKKETHLYCPSCWEKAKKIISNL